MTRIIETKPAVSRQPQHKYQTAADTSKPREIGWETKETNAATGIVAMLQAVAARTFARQRVSFDVSHSHATTNRGVCLTTHSDPP